MRYDANPKDVYFFHLPLKGVTAIKTIPYVKIAKDKKFVKTLVKDSPHFAFVKSFLELPKKSFLNSEAYKKYEEYARIESIIYGGEHRKRLHAPKKFMRLIGNFNFKRYADGATGAVGAKWRPIQVFGVACFAEDHQPTEWTIGGQDDLDRGLTGLHSEFAHHSDGDDGMVKYELARIYDSMTSYPEIKKEITEWLDGNIRTDLFITDGLHRSAILAYYQKKITCRLVRMNVHQQTENWTWQKSLGLRAGFKL